jgi:hypothetical protein
MTTDGKHPEILKVDINMYAIPLVVFAVVGNIKLFYFHWWPIVSIISPKETFPRNHRFDTGILKKSLVLGHWAKTHQGQRGRFFSCAFFR